MFVRRPSQSFAACVLVGWWTIIAFGLAWNAALAADEPQAPWTEIAPAVWRSAGLPCAYALVEDKSALVIGAAGQADLTAMKRLGVERIERVLLTHHHRDTSAQSQSLIDAGIPVLAPRASADWLTVEGVSRFWRTALPKPAEGREPPLKERTFNEWSFLVHPSGIEGIDCSLEDGQRIEWRSWTLEVIATPGHSRDHTAYAAQRTTDGAAARAILFCGDALAAPGKLWTPYSTDWDHWTDQGLQAAAASLRRLASVDAAILCPEHGPPIEEEIGAALQQTAAAALRAGFLKSFERYSKQELGNPPEYAFVAKEQVSTAGDEPWTRLLPHLYLTGNTYALLSDDGSLLLLDAYGPRIVEQVHKLQADLRLGPLERVLVTHAHNDHYKGLFLLPDRASFEVATVEEVAVPIGRPSLYCAPYLDARPVRVDRTLHDGQTLAWHEHRLRIRHLPGQTWFGLGIEAEIDGKRCFFTGDNFYHADQFSGSGGWSGRNRGWPLSYAASARAVFKAKPDWVTAEHGGAFEFNAEDFRRRVRWAEESAAAADALSPSGRHRRDWDPQRVHVEPLVQQASPGGALNCRLVADNPLDEAETLSFRLDGRNALMGNSGSWEVPPHGSSVCEIRTPVPADCPAGRYVVPVVVQRAGQEDPSDVFFVVDVAQVSPARGR